MILALLFFFWILISFFLIITSEYIIYFLFSKKYQEVVEIFQILLLLVPFIFLSSLLKNKAEAQKKNKILYQIHFIVPLSSILLAFIVFYCTKNIYYFFFTKIITLKISESILLSLHNTRFFKNHRWMSEHNCHLM